MLISRRARARKREAEASQAEGGGFKRHIRRRAGAATETPPSRNMGLQPIPAEANPAYSRAPTSGCPLPTDSSTAAHILSLLGRHARVGGRGHAVIYVDAEGALRRDSHAQHG